MRPRFRCLWVLAVGAFVVLQHPQTALAWGPATHVKLAHDILDQLASAAPLLAAMLSRYARDFVFGNIAADVVFAKRLSRVKQACHQWTTAFRILDTATSDAARAFAHGYLAHLAADTVAHNKFIPRQMAVTRTTLSFGHLYWELRADSAIGQHYWDELRRVIACRFEQHERILAAHLIDTLLPFTWNRAIFYRLNRIVSRRRFIRTTDAWYDRSRWDLPDDVLAEYRAESVERAVDVLAHREQSPVVHEDPNGTVALSYSKIIRRQHRRMERAGLLHAHVLAEATARHGPVLQRRRPPPPAA